MQLRISAYMYSLILAGFLAKARYYALNILEELDSPDEVRSRLGHTYISVSMYY